MASRPRRCTPTSALQTLLGKADASCKLPWNLVAAIGRVESNHGRSDGNSLNADGIAKPGIYGVLLDGHDGRAKINDTDSGAIDRNAVYDRAVGPMQFIPATWKSVAVDADNDGMKNPQDIDDAATAAGIYLCAGVGDLSTDSGAAAAVQRYNHSSSYVELVMKISAAYAAGDYTQSPNGFSTSTVLTDQSNDQTLTPAQRAKAKKAEQNANHKPKPGNGWRRLDRWLRRRHWRHRWHRHRHRWWLRRRFDRWLQRWAQRPRGRPDRRPGQRRFVRRHRQHRFRRIGHADLGAGQGAVPGSGLSALDLVKLDEVHHRPAELISATSET